MFHNADFLTMLAKRLSMLANDRVEPLSQAASRGVMGNRDPKVTSATLALMPHIVEKAILTSPALTGDVAQQLASSFLREFELLLRIVCNAGGFSNSMKKALFNATYHMIFQRQYNRLKPTFDKLWHLARETTERTFELVAVGVLTYCASSSGLSLDSPKSVAAVQTEVESLFHAVHDLIAGRG